MAETQHTSTLRLVTKSRLYIAELKRRWIATFVDSILLALVYGPVYWSIRLTGFHVSKLASDTLMFALYLSYHTLMSTGGRQTFGKRYQKIMIVDHAGLPLSIGRGLLRAFSRSFFLLASYSAFPFNLYFAFLYFIDVSLALKDKTSRTLHDQVSDSYVVQAFEPVPGSRGQFIRRVVLFYGFVFMFVFGIGAVATVGVPTFRKLVAKSAAQEAQRNAAAVEGRVQP